MDRKHQDHHNPPIHRPSPTRLGEQIKDKGDHRTNNGVFESSDTVSVSPSDKSATQTDETLTSEQRHRSSNASKADVVEEDDHAQFCQMVERMRKDLRTPELKSYDPVFHVNGKGSFRMTGKKTALSRFRPPSSLGLPHRKPDITLGCRSPFVFTNRTIRTNGAGTDSSSGDLTQTVIYAGTKMVPKEKPNASLPLSSPPLPPPLKPPLLKPPLLPSPQPPPPPPLKPPLLPLLLPPPLLPPPLPSRKKHMIPTPLSSSYPLSASSFLQPMITQYEETTTRRRNSDISTINSDINSVNSNCSTNDLFCRSFPGQHKPRSLQAGSRLTLVLDEHMFYQEGSDESTEEEGTRDQESVTKHDNLQHKGVTRQPVSNNSSPSSTNNTTPRSVSPRSRGMTFEKSPYQQTNDSPQEDDTTVTSSNQVYIRHHVNNIRGKGTTTTSNLHGDRVVNNNDDCNNNIRNDVNSLNNNNNNYRQYNTSIFTYEPNLRHNHQHQQPHLESHKSPSPASGVSRHHEAPYDNSTTQNNHRKPPISSSSVLQRNIHHLSLSTNSPHEQWSSASKDGYLTESPPSTGSPTGISLVSHSGTSYVSNNNNNNNINRNCSMAFGEDVISRRRNFSSSSLPRGIMSSTIEEVDDTDNNKLCLFHYNTYPHHHPPLHHHQQQQPQQPLHRHTHSDAGTCPHCMQGMKSNVHTNTVTSTPPIRPVRTLRREPCIAGMSSPPKPHHRPMTSPLVRSASENIPKSSILKDVDIVGESFESRFPWQRDVSIQCFLGDTTVTSRQQPHHELLRSVSSPASCCFSRSFSLTSNSPASSPPKPPRRQALSFQSRSCSNTDLITPSHQVTDDRSICPPPSCTQPYPDLQYALPTCSSLDQSSVCGVSDSNCSTSFQSRRANFYRRPRPNSMGAVENIRYQHELTKFREMHNARRDRKSDPQLVFSPVTVRKRMLSTSQEEHGSTSDLESILEYPGDRPWDISRHTSMTSVDFDDDMSRIIESGVLGNAPEMVDDYLRRDDVLVSPRVSPKYWATFDEDGDISGSDDSACFAENSLSSRHKSLQQPKQPRRLSSGSITSDAESEATEPDLPVARRGRRSAIYETKNCGDVSPTTLSPEASPCNSCDEGEGASNIAERLRRRRSSVDLAMNIYPGDLLVQEHHKKLIKRNTIADFYASGKQPSGSPSPGTPSGPEGNDASKKGRQPFSLLKLMKTRSKESLTKIDEVLKRLKPSEFKDNHLAAYKSLHWSDLIASTDKQTNNSQLINLSDTERKRREAVWELFKSECVFLIDHLMVLKHCFMEPLKKVQVEGSLMFAEPQDIFGNLDELSYVSYTFCKDFIAALLKDMSITDFGRTNVLLKAFQRFSAHSRDGAVFHSYCLNYTNALSYLEKLRTNSEFGEFEKWCEQDPRCNRLQLTDLLVAPMQHCTKLPLLLHNVMKYTADEDERQQVAESIEKVEASLKQLEEKMRWIKNFERVQEVQRQIVWPTVTELDPRCVIPECLKLTVSKQPCERLLACPKRQLLYEGQVILVETPKPLDIHMFLFDDILLITKIKKGQRKQKQSTTDLQSIGNQDKTPSYVVLRQPLALDRFSLHDIGPTDAAVNGLKHCFVLVQISRYQQITGVFTFQAPCEATKSTWLHQLKEAMESYSKAPSHRDNAPTKTPKTPDQVTNGINPALIQEELAHNSHHNNNNNNNNNVRKLDLSFHSGVSNPNSLRNSGRGPMKSRSMDAVYI